MIFGVIGSREFNDYGFLSKTLDCYKEVCKITKIVSGGAKGADTLAKRYAKENDIDFEEFPAEWDKYGKSAGPRRNEKIVKKSDIIIAFPVKGLENKGTNNSISLAKQFDKDVVVCEYQVDETENIG